jgi:hypothetical protein
MPIKTTTVRRLSDLPDGTIVHRIPVFEGTRIVVVFEPVDADCWEWLLCDMNGRVITGSADGYGNPSLALRDGLVHALPIASR